MLITDIKPAKICFSIAILKTKTKNKYDPSN